MGQIPPITVYSSRDSFVFMMSLERLYVTVQSAPVIRRVRESKQLATIKATWHRYLQPIGKGIRVWESYQARIQPVDGGRMAHASCLGI